MYPAEVYRSYLTPLRFLERSAAIFREKPAVVYGERSWTYPQLFERVRRLAAALRAAGIERGDRVACLLPNIPPMLDAHYGVPRAGAVLVSINTRLSTEEVRYILDHSGAKLLIVDTALAGTVKPVVGELKTVRTIVSVEDVPGGVRIDGPEYEAWLAGASPAETFAGPLTDEDETISINYTSGTTGRPKGVMYTHRGAYLNALGEVVATHMTSDAVYLWTLPMFHCNGWCFTWGVTAIGGTHVCLRAVDPALVWRLIREGSITHLNGAPTVLIALANHPAAEDGPLPRRLTVTTAGAPPSPTIIGQIEALGAEIIHVYGLTETYGPYSICEWQSHWNALPNEQRARLKARQGVPYVVADDIRVVDEQLRDVPADAQTLGEVVMRGNNVMKGYFADAEATAQAFGGGWFHSGDIGVMHPDGYVELRDRKKDIIISGGENISTIEVEQAIAGHPAVLEVAVVAVPDQYWGERPKAFVTLKPGRAATAAEIIAHCRDRLAHFKCPNAVAFGDLPKTSTGKIQKFVLRDREWAAKEKRIN